MAIGVQTDMCTPALAKYGSHELRQQFLAPSIAGDYVGCIGVSEVEAGSDVAGIRTKAVKDGGMYIFKFHICRIRILAFLYLSLIIIKVLTVLCG